MISLRPFDETDRAAVSDIRNSDLAADSVETVADWIRRDAAMLGDEVFERWVIGTPAVAYLEVKDMGTAHVGWRSIAGICEMELVVASAERNKGFGQALYEQALRFAAEHHAHTLRIWFSQAADDCPLLSFLQQRGFAEHSARNALQLDLTTFDPTPYLPQVRDLEARGIRFLNYADLADSTENRRKLYDLFAALETVTPGDTFEIWAKQKLAGRDWTARILLLAELDGEWLGLTEAAHIIAGQACQQGVSGTLANFRGQGIATALKVKAYQNIVARGCVAVKTSTRFDNAPMLAINRKMGFVPTSTGWTYDKPLKGL